MVPGPILGVGHETENTTLEKAAIVTETAKSTYDILDHQETLVHMLYHSQPNDEVGKISKIKHGGQP